MITSKTPFVFLVMQDGEVLYGGVAFANRDAARKVLEDDLRLGNSDLRVVSLHAREEDSPAETIFAVCEIGSTHGPSDYVEITGVLKGRGDDDDFVSKSWEEMLQDSHPVRGGSH